MKSILFTNRKGGVGKSAVASQFAYYCADRLKKRVLFLDLDGQGNSTKAIGLSGLASTSGTTAAKLMTTKGAKVESGDGFVLVPACEELNRLERQGEKRNEFAGNLKSFIASTDADFDICVIDTNPSPDIRMQAALVSASHVLAPIELNQEAIDGIRYLFNDVTAIQNHPTLNPDLSLIGILPNKVVNTPFQKDNLGAVMKHFHKALIELPTGGYALIRNSTAIAEAQAEGKPLWKIAKTSARDAWREIEPAFKQIAAVMGVNTNDKE